MSDLDRARGMFPGMPGEVFDCWLAEVIAFQGWPFRSILDSIEVQNWSGILLGRTLAEWAKATWTYEAFDGDELLPLHPKSADLCMKILMAFFQGSDLVNGVELRESNERVRIHRATIQETRTFPGFLTGLMDGGRLLLVDGHHRRVAYRLANPENVPIPCWVVRIEA